MLVKPKDASTITVDILNHLELLVIPSKRALIAFIEKNGLQDNEIVEIVEGANGGVDVIESNGASHFVITIIEHERRVIIHECVHAAHVILESKGIPVDTNNSEIIAYLTDFLCEKVFEIIEGEKRGSK